MNVGRRFFSKVKTKGAGGLGNRVGAAGGGNGSLNFADTERIFASRSTFELVRAWAVFRVCGWRGLVRRADWLLAASQRLLGTRLTHGLIRHTFFAHFCAGERGPEVRPTVEQLRSAGVGSILDYAAEADVQSSQQTDSARRQQRLDETKYRTRGVVSARTYVYEDEAQCEANADVFAQCIEAARDSGDAEPFVAIKLTALAKPELLEKVSTVLLAVRQIWHDEFGAHLALSESVTRERFGQFVNRLGVQFSPAETDQLFAQLSDGLGGDKVDYIEWTQHLSLWSLTPRKLFAESGYDYAGILRPLAAQQQLPLLDEADLRLLGSFQDRLRRLTALAAQHGIRLMIDAEQTYMQPAIDHYVRTLQLEFNRTGPLPVVFNTYQAYLTYSYQHLELDLQRARRLNYLFGGKLVRGAYMVGERLRAELHERPSPIWPSVEETHLNYNRCVELVLRTMANEQEEWRQKRQESETGAAGAATVPGGLNVMVATHNQYSIVYTTQLMEDLGLDRQATGVFFGQLLGMGDHLTYALGASGYKAYKYVPYGQVSLVVPYLMRRAQENAEMLANSVGERKIIAKEIKRRFTLWRTKEKKTNVS